MRYFQKIKVDWFLVFLILIILILIKTNYTPGTFLSGWDTLHPEFNLGLYLRRILNVWQGHQGLGAPPSQAHAADLPRMIFVFFSSLLFPMSFVRYSYFFAMLVLGTLGIYFLLLYLFQNTSSQINRMAAFLGSLFYILNLGTMQHFVVPLEMFATKFGFLGFIFLFLTKYLDKGRKIDLIYFALTIIFSSPMAHTATLWYVFFAGLVLYVTFYILLNKNQANSSMRRGVTILVLTLTLNLYWILPNVYYSLNYGKDVISSKIHRLFTEEAYLHNKQYGNLTNLTLFKNFLFNWRIQSLDSEGEAGFKRLLLPWALHLSYPPILFLGYFFGASSFVGGLLSLVKKNKRFLPFLPILAFAGFFLLSDTPLLSSFFELLRGSSQFFKEILRFPFTKFSLYLVFCSAIFFGLLQKLVMEKMLPILKLKNVFFNSIFFVSVTFLLVSYMFPAFQGNFINPSMRVRIPPEYFELFAWSKSQDDSRMLTLPLHTLFGWTYYKWNFPDKTQIYQGAGFNWFGLKQPTLNREFDRWYPYNEQSYREFSYAVYSKNAKLFSSLLDKYNIRYVLLDKSVTTPGDVSEQKKLFFPELENLLKQIGSIKLDRNFGDFLYVFKYTPFSRSAKKSKIIDSAKVIEPSYKTNYFDQAYLEQGDYISNSNNLSNQTTLFYPARNILNQQERVNKEIMKVDENSYHLDLAPNKNIAGVLEFSKLSDVETAFYADLTVSRLQDPEYLKLHLNYLLPYQAQYKKKFTQEKDIKIGKSNLISVDNFIFSLPAANVQNPVFSGELLVNPNQPIRVRTYDADKTKKLTILIPELVPYLCEEPSGKEIFGADSSKARIRLYGRSAKICAEFGLKEFIDLQSVEKNGVLEAFFAVKHEKNTQATFCVFNLSTNSCSSRVLLPKSDQATTTRFSNRVLLDSNLKDNLILRISYDATSLDEIEDLSITNLSSYFYPEDENFDFPLQFPNFRQEIASTALLYGDTPKNQLEIDLKTLGVERTSCGFHPASESQKKYLSKLLGLEYKTVDGAICDSLAFPELSQSVGYIIGIDSQNVDGLPLKICFENEQTKSCVFEDELSKFRRFDTDFFVIPPYHQGFGYNLVLNNFSIGNIPSINRVRKISIIPFPYSFFQSVRISQNPQELSAGKIIAYDQAYERNWKAFYIPKSLTLIQLGEYLAPLFGKKLKDHVLVNNWANGWALPPPEAGFAPQGTKVVIIFWPQYLQYLGFFFLIGNLVYILKFKIN